MQADNDMLAEDKLAHQLLGNLQSAEALGSGSEACRQGRLTCTQFYEYKRRFAEQRL
jgi:hypothetical protein